MTNYNIICMIVSDGDSIIFETFKFQHLHTEAKRMLKSSGYFEEINQFRKHVNNMDIGTLFNLVEERCNVEIRIREVK